MWPIFGSQIGNAGLLRLSVNRQPARLTALNGGFIRVAIRDHGAFALIPLIRNEGVSITVIEITTDPLTHNERLQSITSLPLAAGEPKKTMLGTVELHIEFMRTYPPQPTASVPVGPCLTCASPSVN
jgi:hypothetical protein